MDVEFIFLLMAGIVFIGFIGEMVFKKTQIPDVLWLMLMGMGLSYFMQFSPKSFDTIAIIFTTFALIFLLFEAGVNMDIMKFIESAPSGMKLTVSSFLLAFIATSIISFFVLKDWVLALMLGAILGGISSAVVLPIVKNINIAESTRVYLIIDSAVSDVLCILATVTIIEVLTIQQFSAANIMSSLLSSFLIAITLGFGLGVLWVKIVYKYLKSKANFYVLTLAFMILVFAVIQILNANGAIACLTFGIVIGNSHILSKNNHVLVTQEGKDFFSQIAFFIKTFFFVYLGSLIDFSEPISFLWAFLIFVGIFLMRPFSVFISYNKDTPLKDVKLTEVLVPKGLAAAVLVQLPVQADIPGAQTLVNIVFAVILISIVISTIMVFFVNKDKYCGIFTFLYKKYDKTKKRGKEE